jgi:ribosomal protein S18 acetylase RimI-like enzyme
METLKVFRADLSHVDLALDAVQNLHHRQGALITSLHAFLEQRENILFLACLDRQVIGSLNGYSLRHPDQLTSQFLLYEIDVHPLFRNKGIGTLLVTAFVELASHLGAFEVWVLTNASNQAAMSMYLKCGFQRKNNDDIMLSMDVAKSK